VKGEFALTDAGGKTEIGTQNIVVDYTIRAGDVARDPHL
jgi:hypothetical protein